MNTQQCAFQMKLSADEKSQLGAAKENIGHRSGASKLFSRTFGASSRPAQKRL